MSRMVKAICLLLLPAFCGVAEMRMWRDADGTFFQAEFVKEVSGTIILQDENGDKRFLKEEDLPPDMLAYIRTQCVPEIRVDFFMSSQPAELPPLIESWHEHNVRDLTGTVTVEKEGRAPYYGRLPAELYIITKEVASDEYRILDIKKFLIEFPGGEDPFGFKTHNQDDVYMEWNKQGMRGARYDGYLLVVFSPDGELFLTDSNYDWLREKEKAQALRSLNKGNFFDEQVRRRSVPRPKFVASPRAKYR